MALENPDEIFVRRLLEDRYGVCLRKIGEEEDVRTPDYELLDGDARVAVAEVKTLQHVPRTEATGWRVERHDPYRWSATRDDNSPSRVSDHIRTAAKQLRRYEEPRILAFLNQEPMMDVHDLEEAVQGFLPYGNDEIGYFLNAASMRIAEGRIREDRWLVDLYVWIEPPKGPRIVFHAVDKIEHLDATEATVAFRVTSERGLSVAHRFFGCPAELPKAGWLRPFVGLSDEDVGDGLES